MKFIYVILVTLVTILIVAGVGYLEVSFWNECRATNSFWYCLRMLQ